jgi:hypothetical protein
MNASVPDWRQLIASWSDAAVSLELGRSYYCEKESLKISNGSLVLIPETFGMPWLAKMRSNANYFDELSLYKLFDIRKNSNNEFVLNQYSSCPQCASGSNEEALAHTKIDSGELLSFQVELSLPVDMLLGWANQDIRLSETECDNVSVLSIVQGRSKKRASGRLVPVFDGFGVLISDVETESV